MPKKVGLYLREHSVTDEDSVGIFLDFDGLKNPEEVDNWIEARVKLGSKITIWDALATVFYILNANKKKR